MSHKDSYSDLVSLLNSAASDDPNQVIVAGQKLVLATTSHLSDRVFESLATILFSLHGNNLTSSGRYVGLVHLRHSLFDSQTWSKLEASERHSIRGMLLNFLASGSDPLRMRNNIELLPQIGSCVTTFFACLVHKDWLKDEWTDDIWEQLMHWCAWSSIRSALRTLAAYRLPARRNFYFKVFTKLIRSLLPVVQNLWQTNSMDLCTTEFDSLIHLSRLLYTCLTTPNLQPRHGPYLLNQDDLSVVEGVFQQSFVILDTLCSRHLGSDWSAKHVKISRRLTKLVLATFLVSNPVVRGKNVKFLLSHAANIVYHQSVHPQLDNKGMTWILALVYGLLSAKVDDPDAHLSLDSYGSSELHKCLFSRSSLEGMHHNGASSNTLLTTFLQNLLHTTFPLSPIEVLGVTSDPEACMAVGGSCIILPGTDLAENVTAPDIWDIDVQAQNLVRVDLQSLINLHGSERQFLGSQSCRQLTELIVTQLLRNYETEAKCVLLELAENMRCAATSPLQYEALMRWTQLILPYTASDPYWRTFSGRVLSSAMIFVTSRLPVTDESEYDRQLIILSARMLCFLMRCIAHSIPTSANEISKFSPVSVAQLVPYLRAGATDGVQVVPLRMCLCIRLTAAHCVAWCLSQPVFPAGTLVTHINSLFCGLVQLLYDVFQCETRVYLLSVLRSLLESTKMTNHLDLAEQMVYVLDHFWQLETSTAALRVSILDTICLLQTIVNHSEEDDARLTEFRILLTPAVSSLIVAALDQLCYQGSEALLESGLRLWQSTISGPCVTWSPVIARLVPILVGRNSNIQALQDPKEPNSYAKPLIDRLDSSKQAELFFEITSGYLNLIDRTDAETRCGFLGEWTEPFWETVLQATSSKMHSNGGRSALDYLYSSAGLSGDDDTREDSESHCRLKQLRLLATWLSLCLDSMTPENALTPSLVGLLVLGARNALLRAPVDAHEDAYPRATELQLGLLARLAVRREYWPQYLCILNTLYACQTGRHNSDVSSYPVVADWQEVDSTHISRLIQLALERWIARIDSVSQFIDRRCYALASLHSLLYCTQTYQIQQVTSKQSEEELEHWALQDTFHAHWLESVINVCLQVLFDEDRSVLQAPVEAHTMHPTSVATDEGLRQTMLAAFAAWQDSVGGEQFANLLLRCHVDRALVIQLHTQLNQSCAQTASFP